MQSLFELEPVFIYRARIWRRFEKDGTEYCDVLADLIVVACMMKHCFSTKTVQRSYLPRDAETLQAIVRELSTQQHSMW